MLSLRFDMPSKIYTDFLARVVFLPEVKLVHFAISANREATIGVKNARYLQKRVKMKCSLAFATKTCIPWPLRKITAGKFVYPLLNPTPTGFRVFFTFNLGNAVGRIGTLILDISLSNKTLSEKSCFLQSPASSRDTSDTKFKTPSEEFTAGKGSWAIFKNI